MHFCMHHCALGNVERGNEKGRNVREMSCHRYNVCNKEVTAHLELTLVVTKQCWITITRVPHLPNSSVLLFHSELWFLAICHLQVLGLQPQREVESNHHLQDLNGCSKHSTKKKPNRYTVGAILPNTQLCILLLNCKLDWSQFIYLFFTETELEKTINICERFKKLSGNLKWSFFFKYQVVFATSRLNSITFQLEE